MDITKLDGIPRRVLHELESGSRHIYVAPMPRYLSAQVDAKMIGY